MKIETKMLDGETWAKVPPGYAVLPLWATESMFMRVGGATMTAREAWAEMAKVAIKETVKVALSETEAAKPARHYRIPQILLDDAAKAKAKTQSDEADGHRAPSP